jgi:hypothetical protein
MQKINNKLYYCKASFNDNYCFTLPERFDYSKLQKKEFIFVIPQEIASDEIVKKIKPQKIQITKFNLKNIDILIKNRLVENKLIKPLYIS